MSHHDEFLLIIAVVLAIPYILGPLLILSTFKLKSPTRIVFFDPDTLQPPRNVAEYLKPACDQLAKLGFEPVAYFCLPDVIKNVKSINVMLVNNAARDTAMVNCIYAEVQGTGSIIKKKFVEFATNFRNDVYVGTNNSIDVSAFRSPPDHHTIQFWNVYDVAELYRRHQQICDQLGQSSRRLRISEEFGNDVEQFLQKAAIEQPADYQVEKGLFRRVDDGFRPTIKGAFLLVWQELWPWKYFRKQARLREARQWLERIDSD